ncbi:ABC transporter permease [Clostridium arbusti]|uniref:ABC transporter permease n=1 Tax=Clostridium arbusti TaxID=1137848 RepID=UPI000288DB37|nr:ABC transporter permease [Clostridium arbusti]
MSVFIIAFKEIKQTFRNKQSILMGLLFPIVLIFILGTVLSGVFSNSSTFKNISVTYIEESKGYLSEGFEGFIDKGNSLGIKFSKVQTADEGLKSVKDGKYTCFLKINDKGMELYKSDLAGIQGDVVESMMKSFLQRYGAVMEIAKVSPSVLAKINSNTNYGGLVKNISLNSKTKPEAMDYYAVTMLTLIILYSSMNGMYSIVGEKTTKTANRLFCTPVSKYKILMGKILGNVIYSAIQIAVIIAFSKFVFHAYWGNHIGTIFIMALAEAVMMVSIGAGMSFIIKDSAALNGLLSMLSTIFSFLGGGYFPIDGMGKNVQLVTNISPVKWINQAMFKVIYSNDFSSVGIAIIMSLLIAAIFIGISSLGYRKEAV